MAKGPFPAKTRIRGDSLSEWGIAGSSAWFGPKCGYLKASRCTYRGHRSLPVSDPDTRRVEKALRRGVREPVCANPECVSPFLPLHARQRYCGDRCRDRAKYLRRRLGHERLET